MYCCLGTTKECSALYGYLPQTVVGEVVRGLAILEAEYGLDRNYLEVGGYSLIADTRDDLSRARDIFDDRKHYCEWSTKLGDSGFCSALYLLTNEFRGISIRIYIYRLEKFGNSLCVMYRYYTELCFFQSSQAIVKPCFIYQNHV